MPIHWVLAAFNLTQDRALLYAKAANKTSLHHLLDRAIDQGATVISIRMIHPIPEGKPLPPPPTQQIDTLDPSSQPPPDRAQSEKGQ